MKQATENKTIPLTNETADLGYGAMLIAEDEDGGYEPVAIVSTLREAREIARQDLKIRTSELEKGGDPLCPARYVVWQPNFRGSYRATATIDAE